jgi:hypothetical protein
MIIETTAGQTYYVVEFLNLDLAHVWLGRRIKLVKSAPAGYIFVGKREEMVRKAGARVLPMRT